MSEEADELPPTSSPLECTAQCATVHCDTHCALYNVPLCTVTPTVTPTLHCPTLHCLPHTAQCASHCALWLHYTALLSTHCTLCHCIAYGLLPLHRNTVQRLLVLGSYFLSCVKCLGGSAHYNIFIIIIIKSIIPNIVIIIITLNRLNRYLNIFSFSAYKFCIW